MNLSRSGALVGLCCTLPIVVWTLGGLAPGQTSATMLVHAWLVVVLLQAGALAWYAPELALAAGLREGLAGLLLAWLVPLPLLVQFWSSAAVDGSALATAQVLLLVFGLLLFLVSTGIRRFAGATTGRFAVVSLQGGVLLAVWGFRQEWLQWLGR